MKQYTKNGPVITAEKEKTDKQFFDDVIKILMDHAGEYGQNEGAVEVLERIIRERDLLIKNSIEVMLRQAHF